MKVLLDTHMLGRQETGNERYWKNLSSSLSKLNKGSTINYSPKLNNGFYRVLLDFNRTVKELEPDIIHVQNFAPFIKSVPIVNTVHDLCFKSYPNLFGLKTNLAFNFFFKRSLDLSDAIICVSKSTKEALSKFYQVDSKKIFVVYEAADGYFRYIKDKIKLTKILKKRFSLNNKYFLVVGNIENRKLPFAIINSFNEVIKKHPDVQLVFVGPNKLKILPTKNVRILNYVSDQELNILYNGAVSLIYLSLCEGFGLPIIEAMATKTPVICSNISVFREITAGNSLLIKNNQELTKAMIALIENNDIRKKYSLLGYKRSKFFSWQKNARETLEIYKWILKNQSSTLSHWLFRQSGEIIK